MTGLMCAHKLYGEVGKYAGEGSGCCTSIVAQPTDFLSGNLKALRYDQKWMEIDGIKVMENI